MKISKGGQVSVPAEVRTRWQTSTVTVDDQGDRLVVRPAPDDPVAATSGVFADEFAGGPSLEAVMRERREEETEAEARKYRRLGR